MYEFIFLYFDPSQNVTAVLILPWWTLESSPCYMNDFFMFILYNYALKELNDVHHLNSNMTKLVWHCNTSKCCIAAAVELLYCFDETYHIEPQNLTIVLSYVRDSTKIEYNDRAC